MSGGESMAELPSGTVTFLFTDIEGSTRLLREHGDGYASVLKEHRRLVRSAFQAHAGREVDTQGDAFFFAFARASDAIAAAMAAQRALSEYAWPGGAVVRVRMGLHSGQPLLTEGGYIGLDVHRAARIAAVGHGGQVLVSDSVRALAEHDLPPALELKDLGEHRLKDLQRAERILQLVIPGLMADFPPLRTLDARANNLPVLRDPLIGREREVAAAREILLRGDVGLLILTGPGGTGKTRLALQLGAELLDEFNHGVFFVGLSSITDAGLVASAVAQTLRIREVAGRPLVETLKDALRNSALLLVLDNFEQVSGAAPLVSELLQACPHLKILVTSRAVLRVSGEHDFPVPPLALPARSPLPPVERLSQYGATRLFIERARAVQPEFRMTDDNASAVVEICHRLDGLPLAIELAAARVRLLSPEAMLVRLERRLLLLVGGARDLPARQQTLRATIAWSHDLLGEAEQRLFRCLAVFNGGCTLDAAEVVCDAEGDAANNGLEGLASLVDKSLVRQEQKHGEVRFSMLQTVREYGLEQLEVTGEAAESRRRHAEHFVALAEHAEPNLTGAEQQTWLERLDAEHDNFRAALGWSLTPERRSDAQSAHQKPIQGRENRSTRVELGLRLASALMWFWYIRSHFSEGRRWLDATLAVSDIASPTVRANALNAAGGLARDQGDYERAVALLDVSLALHRNLHDKRGIAWTLYNLGRAIRDQGDYDRATKLHEESLALFREIEDQAGVANTLNMLGTVAQFKGDFERALPLLKEGLTLLRQRGDKRGVAWSLHTLGRIALARGDYERATALHEESLALRRELAYTRGVAWSLHDLGRVAQAGCEHDRATALLRESLELRRDLCDRWGIAECLEGLATVSGAKQGERAAHLFGTAQVLREAMSAARPATERADYERDVSDVRRKLGETAFSAAWADGRAMTLDEAIAYALEVPPP